MSNRIELQLGVKSDPIEYRYSWEWLMRLMAEEKVRFVQVGSFFELYQLPDSTFHAMREEAEHHGVTISSVFTAHRELGGFFRDDAAWHNVALRNFERLIQVGKLLGAKSVGSNPGSILRDQMHFKPKGVRNYIEAMKQLMHFAKDCGIETLTMEPMSCLAEPPTTPVELVDMAEELRAYHLECPGETVDVGYCFDISHGHVDQDRRMLHSNLDLLDTALPYLYELHLKNTDKFLESTFGFSEEERARGVIDVAGVRDYLYANAERLPVRELVGYLEIGGPKLGRDYSDRTLGDALRTSLRHLHSTFLSEPSVGPVAVPVPSVPAFSSPPAIRIAPSVMCADLGSLRDEVQLLESLGADMLHWDLMDAHFVPSMPCGLASLEKLRAATKLPFDVHLMVEDNEFFIKELSKIGVEMISVHYESTRHCDRTLSLIRDMGAKAGIALNPSTPPTVLKYVSHLLDFLVVMTVNPGFAGQKLTGSGMAKIADCRQWLQQEGLDIPIEVDGNVSFENIPQMIAAGADILVAGTSSLFSRGAPMARNMGRMRATIGTGVQLREQHTALAVEA